MSRIAIGLLLLLSSCTRSAVPATDPQQLVAAFDLGPGPKLIAMFSPRCATCLASAQALQRALETFPNADLRVYVIWVPIERMDSLRGVPPAALARIHDLRVQQSWDPKFEIAKRLCKNEPSTSSACRDSAATPLWGFVGLWPANARWGTWPQWSAFDPDEPTLKGALDQLAQLGKTGPAPQPSDSPPKQL